MKRAAMISLALAPLFVVAASFAPVSSAKPPAPPPPPPRTWSCYDANGQPYGGLRDSQTGLVCGFFSVAVRDYLNGVNPNVYYSPGGSLSVAQQLRFSEDPLTTYPDVSNSYWARNDTDWRLPTKDQLVDAWQGGLMQNIDASLEPGFQTYIDGQGAIAGAPATSWTSTLQGRKYTYVFLNYVGTTKLVTIDGSSSFWIPVRGPVPP